MRAYKNFNKFDSSQPFWSWIATIANNHCIDVLRKNSRTKELFGDEVFELEALSAISPDEQNPVMTNLIDDQNAGTLNEAIAALPDKYRVPLVLAYFNQQSYDAIAEHLDIKKSHVGVLLLRGKKLIRQTLTEKTDGAVQ